MNAAVGRLVRGIGRAAMWTAFLLPLLSACRADSPGGAGAAAIDSREVSCRRCNILLVLIDTLRADHLGVYGYERATSPHIDQLASDAFVFREMIAQSTWTKPATASLLTGLYPKNHGAHDQDDRLGGDRVLLSEYLQRAGYTTHAFVANGNAGKPFNFDRGYDTFVAIDEEADAPDTRTRSDRVNEQVLPFLSALDATDPFLLYVHYVDPHVPYDPGERLFSFDNIDFGIPFFTENRYASYLADPNQRRALHRQLVDAYDDEIRFNDMSFGALMAALEARGLLDSTVVVVVSDHGEEILERQQHGHAKIPYEEQLRVPLIIRVPGAGHRSITHQVGQIDLVPTLLSVVGVEVPAGLDGQNALRRRSDDEMLFAELDSHHMKCSAVRARGEKLFECEKSVPPARDESGATWRWFESVAAFEYEGRVLELEVESFHSPREVVVKVGDAVIGEAIIHPGRQTLRFEVGEAGPYRVEIQSRTRCTRPVDVHYNHSESCIAFRIFGSPRIDLTEVSVPLKGYYKLEQDRGERNNLMFAGEDPARLRDLAMKLERYAADRRVGGAEDGERAVLSEAEIEALRALGYSP